MFITDADRAGALRIARARTEARTRGTGVYRVTVGGIVVGKVERHAVATSKTATWWTATDDKGARIEGAYNTRTDAVQALAVTDGAAQAYRAAALDGAGGVTEEARVREEEETRYQENLAILDERDAVNPEVDGPVLERVQAGTYRTADGRFTVQHVEEGNYRISDECAPHLERYDRNLAEARETIEKILGIAAEFGFTAEEVITIPIAAARPGDLIIELDGDAIKADPVKVLQPQAHIYGAGKGPIGIRVDWGSRATACYLYVDQYPRITVRRPSSHWTRFPVGATVAHKDDDHAARSTAVVIEPTVDEWLDMDRDDLPAVLVQWLPGRRVWEYAEDLQKI